MVLKRIILKYIFHGSYVETLFCYGGHLGFMVEINVMRTIPHIDLWFRRVKNK
jgi:hypothetical protein